MQTTMHKYSCIISTSTNISLTLLVLFFSHHAYIKSVVIFIQYITSFLQKNSAELQTLSKINFSYILISPKLFTDIFFRQKSNFEVIR